MVFRGHPRAMARDTSILSLDEIRVRDIEVLFSVIWEEFGSIEDAVCREQGKLRSNFDIAPALKLVFDDRYKFRMEEEHKCTKLALSTPVSDRKGTGN